MQWSVDSMQWSVASGTSKRTGRRSTTNFGRCRCAWRSKCSVSMRTPRTRSHKGHGVTVADLSPHHRHSPLVCNVSRSKSWNVADVELLRPECSKKEVNSGLLHGRSGVLLHRQIPRGIGVGTGPWWRDRQDRIAHGRRAFAERWRRNYEAAAYCCGSGRWRRDRRNRGSGTRRAVRSCCWETSISAASARSGDGSEARAAAYERDKRSCASEVAALSARLREARDARDPPGASEEEGAFRWLQKAQVS